VQHVSCKCRGIMLLLVQYNSLWEVWINCFHLQDFFCWDNTVSLWCCYCLHCELRMLHISHYRLWGSTDLSKFEVQKSEQQSAFLLKSVSYQRQMSFWVTETKVAVMLEVKVDAAVINNIKYSGSLTVYYGRGTPLFWMNLITHPRSLVISHVLIWGNLSVLSGGTVIL
jgi:hypothetical protein